MECIAAPRSRAFSRRTSAQSNFIHYSIATPDIGVFALFDIIKPGLSAAGSPLGVARTALCLGLHQTAQHEQSNDESQSRIFEMDGKQMTQHETVLSQIFSGAKNIAIVGLSPKPDRDSFQIGQAMQRYGFRIIPIHPQAESILGEKCYPTLSEVPEKIDIVNVFRKSEAVLPVVEEAIKVGCKAIWVQLGIRNKDALAAAKKAGIPYQEDSCILVEYKRARSTLFTSR